MEVQPPRPADDDFELELKPEPYSPAATVQSGPTYEPAAAPATDGSVEATSSSRTSVGESFAAGDEAMAGELLEPSSGAPDESLESIVETMKRDRA